MNPVISKWNSFWFIGGLITTVLEQSLAKPTAYWLWNFVFAFEFKTTRVWEAGRGQSWKFSDCKYLCIMYTWQSGEGDEATRL